MTCKEKYELLDNMRKDPSLINTISYEDDPELYLSVLEDNYKCLFKIKGNPTEEMILAAMRYTKGALLQFLKEDQKTPKICMKAVLDNPVAMKYVNDQSEQFCLEVLSKVIDPVDAFINIRPENRTFKICKKALKRCNNERALTIVSLFINNLTEDEIEDCLRIINKKRTDYESCSDWDDRPCRIGLDGGKDET